MKILRITVGIIFFSAVLSYCIGCGLLHSSKELFQTAVYYDSIGNCQKAIKFYSKAIKKEETPEYYYRRGKAKEKCAINAQEGKDAILLDYSKSTHLQPYYIPGLWAIAEYYYSQEISLPFIIEVCNVILDKDTSFFKAYALKGAVYLRQRDTVSAKAEFSKAIIISKNKSDAYLVVGNYSYDQNFDRWAASYYRSSFNSRTDKITFEGFHNLTLAYWNLGMKDSACYYAKACPKYSSEPWHEIQKHCVLK